MKTEFEGYLLESGISIWQVWVFPTNGEEGNSVAIIIPESQFGRYGCFLLMERRVKAAIIIHLIL